MSVLGKILEHIIGIKIDNAIAHSLSSRQHGYTTGRSTFFAIKSVKDWITARNEKYVLGAFLYISGAFDNVSWDTLIQDMSNIGIDNKTIRICASYLMNRKATNRMGSVEKSVTLTRGCPQGSKLGPRFWIISANATLTAVEYYDYAEITAYADDFALLVAADTRKELVHRLELMLDDITCWSEERGLEFSPTKSVMLVLKGNLTLGFTAKFGRGRIKSVQCTKYLGVYIDHNNTHETHIKQILDNSNNMFS